jgi:hypothetical protein
VGAVTLLNPWVILGIVLAIAGAGFQGYRMGSKSAQDAARAAHATALEAAIAAAKANALIDAQALIDHERDRQAVKTVFVDKVRTITETIHANPTTCTVPAGYRVSINELIAAANTTATPVDGKLPAPAPAGK